MNNQHVKSFIRLAGLIGIQFLIFSPVILFISAFVDFFATSGFITGSGILVITLIFAALILLNIAIAFGLDLLITKWNIDNKIKHLTFLAILVSAYVSTFGTFFCQPSLPLGFIKGFPDSKTKFLSGFQPF